MAQASLSQGKAPCLGLLGACFAAVFAIACPVRADTPQETATGTVDASLYRAPAEGGVRRWQAVSGDGLDLRQRPSMATEVIARLSSGAVLSNFGCTEEAAEGWCEVRPFRGGARGFVPAGSLLPAHGPDGVVPTGPNDSKHRAGRRDFDADGEIACAQERGQALGTCAAAVARSGGGDATVLVTFPNGFARQLYFVHGEFVSASATMSGAGRDTDWRLDAGLHHIRVDDQRFELPDRLVFGD